MDMTLESVLEAAGGDIEKASLIVEKAKLESIVRNKKLAIQIAEKEAEIAEINLRHFVEDNPEI